MEIIGNCVSNVGSDSTIVITYSFVEALKRNFENKIRAKKLISNCRETRSILFIRNGLVKKFNDFKICANSPD